MLLPTTKVAHIVGKHEVLDQLFHALKCFATRLRIERDQRAMQTILKIAAPPNMTEDERRYAVETLLNADLWFFSMDKHSFAEWQLEVLQKCSRKGSL